ncbi:MAG: NAD(P)-dependent oxidoreductase [Candidatus Limnocylindrales bacterium]
MITGAAGIIGRVLAAPFAASHDLVLLDRRPDPDLPLTLVDLADRDGLVRAFGGAEAVIHLAATSDVAAAWDAVLESNIVGLHNVFDAAVAARVPRVVFASSNHVVGMYERDGAPSIYTDRERPALDQAAAIRPDSLYGVSKAFGEALGRYYAETHGLRVICLRIGTVLAVDDPTAPLVEAAPAWAPGPWELRIRATWLSHRDCVELFRCALSADVAFAIAYGVSDTPGRFWDLEEARQVLGFRPADRWPGED